MKSSRFLSDNDKNLNNYKNITMEILSGFLEETFINTVCKILITLTCLAKRYFQ